MELAETDIAQEMRHQVTVLIRNGRNDSQIFEELSKVYGPHIMYEHDGLVDGSMPPVGPEYVEFFSPFSKGFLGACMEGDDPGADTYFGNEIGVEVVEGEG